MIVTDRPVSVDSQNSTEPEAQKKDTAADLERRHPAGSDPARDAQNPAAERPAPTLERFVGGRIGNQGAELRGLAAWLNSEAISVAGLRGKVVLVDFWSHTCIN